MSKNRRNFSNRNAKQQNANSHSSNSSLEAMLNANPNLSEEAATISFATTLGGRYPLSDGNTSALNKERTLPGVMIMKFHPTYGVSTSADSALNSTALKLYTKVRAKISGARNYDHTNMFMYYMACDSLFMFWAHCQRALQLVNLYSISNRYLPKSIVEGLGFDYENLINNQANFKLWMDTYAKNIGKFAVPADSTLFARHVAMCSDIYVDQPSVRAQIYALKPGGYYVYDEITEPGKTYLKYVPIEDDSLTFEEARNIIHTMVNALANSADVVNYSADIATAFDGQLWSINGYNDITLEAKYDPAMLASIHNADIQYFNWSNMDVHEDINGNNDPYLVVNPTASCLGYDSHILLDTIEGSTHPTDVLMMTRFKCQPNFKEYVPAADPFGAYFRNCTFNALPTEVITSVVIYYFGINNSGEFALRNTNLSGLSGICSRNYTDNPVTFLGDSFRLLMGGISMCSKFNHAPIMKLWHIADADDACVWDYIGEMDTFSNISENVLSNIHEVALISLLGI